MGEILREHGVHVVGILPSRWDAIPHERTVAAQDILSAESAKRQVTCKWKSESQQLLGIADTAGTCVRDLSGCGHIICL